MTEAKWCLDYDMHTDKLYLCPSCPDCEAPVFPTDDGCKCVLCGQLVGIDPEMQKWFDERAGEKVEVTECFSCRQNKFERHLFKNPVTLEWLTGWGECENCGMRLIV